MPDNDIIFNSGTTWSKPINTSDFHVFAVANSTRAQVMHPKENKENSDVVKKNNLDKFSKAATDQQAKQAQIQQEKSDAYGKSVDNAISKLDTAKADETNIAQAQSSQISAQSGTLDKNELQNKVIAAHDQSSKTPDALLGLPAHTVDAAQESYNTTKDILLQLDKSANSLSDSEISALTRDEAARKLVAFTSGAVAEHGTGKLVAGVGTWLEEFSPLVKSIAARAEKYLSIAAGRTAESGAATSIEDRAVAALTGQDVENVALKSILTKIQKYNLGIAKYNMNDPEEANAFHELITEAKSMQEELKRKSTNSKVIDDFLNSIYNA